jgi:undecaprenyl-diphosphatase
MGLYLKILVLALIQGAAELLPVSSSAHVILAQKLMGEDPSDPKMVFLLIMLHTGTMFAAITYFWSGWKAILLSPNAEPGSGRRFALMIVLATAATGVLGLGLKFLIEHVVLERMLGRPHGEVEELFNRLWLVGTALSVAGVLILVSSRSDRGPHGGKLSAAVALLIGLVQGLCLPFRGLSRSGATISVALMCGLPRRYAEEFSFALAVVLTPAIIVRGVLRLRAIPEAANVSLLELALPGLVGMLLAFLSGLVALRLLSAVLEGGRWAIFGVYCLVFAGVVFAASLAGL